MGNISLLLDNKISEINQQIDDLSSKIVSEKSVEDLASLTDEEIVSFLQEYNIPDSTKKAGLITLYFIFEKNPAMRNIYPNNSNIGINAIKNIINEVNEYIRKENSKVNKSLQELKNQLELYSKVTECFYLDSLSEKNFEEIASTIIGLPISDEEKVDLSMELARKLINNCTTKTAGELIAESEPSDEITDSFEEDLEAIIGETNTRVLNEIENGGFLAEDGAVSERTKQINLANGMISKYFSPASKHVLSGYEYLATSKEDHGITMDDLLEMIENDGGYEIEFFANAIMICINKIKESDSEVDEYYKNLLELDELYNEHDRFISDFNNKYEGLEQLFLNILNNSSKANDATIDISGYQQKLFDLHKKVEKKILFKESREYIKSELDKLLHELNQISNKVVSSIGEYGSEERTSGHTKISSFVLFDDDNLTHVPYVLDDLIGRNVSKMIENAAVNGSLSDRNYQAGIAKLIKDLIVFGAPEVLASIDSSSQNYSEKMMSPIYYTKNGKVVDRTADNKTDLWRIRPTPRSNIRFMGRKIVLYPETEVFRQVKNIILKHLPNVEIDDNANFELFVCIAVGIKRSDKSIYNQAKNRYENENSRLFSLFYEDGKYHRINNQTVSRKEKFSEEESAIFEEYIKTSFNVCDQLHEANNNFDFSFFNEMGGTKKYGL